MRWPSVKELAAVVVGAVIVASLLRGFVGQMFFIPSISMENTLQIDDRVVVEKLSAVKRGQVVVFKDPGGWLTGATARRARPDRPGPAVRRRAARHSTEHLIKRVVGLPGDHVVCCDAEGRITVNGRAAGRDLLSLHRTGRCTGATVEHQVRRRRARRASSSCSGDNRDDSRDSRCHLNDTQAGGDQGRECLRVAKIWSWAAPSLSSGRSTGAPLGDPGYV